MGSLIHPPSSYTVPNKRKGEKGDDVLELRGVDLGVRTLKGDSSFLLNRYVRRIGLIRMIDRVIIDYSQRGFGCNGYYMRFFKWKHIKYNNLYKEDNETHKGFLDGNNVFDHAVPAVRSMNYFCLN